MAEDQEKKKEPTPEAKNETEETKPPADDQPSTEPVDLGKYAAGEGSVKLDQEQILGVGGGSLFFEIVDSTGISVKHIAMPVLLRERPIVKELLKAHAQTLIDIQNKIGEASEEDIKSGAVATELEELEERDIKILLKVAHYCFKRVDPNMKGLDEAAGMEYCESWMDIKQLRKVPEVAMGLNRFTPLLGTDRM